MASALTGLDRTLTWQDFPRKQGRAPGAGESASAAFTSTSYDPGRVSVQPDRGTRPPQFRIVDSLAVAAKFIRNQSWVMSWVFDKPQSEQDNLLGHEQGHYEITALICRDYFIDAMLLKAQSFSSAHAGISAIDQLQANSVKKIQDVQDLYDENVHPDQEAGDSHGPNQQTWDRIIQSAFTTPRATGTKEPNGTTHKERLLDVLSKNGKQV